MGTKAPGSASWMTHLGQRFRPFLEVGPFWMAADVEEMRSGPNLCVIPAWGRGSSDKGTLNSNSRSSLSGQTGGRGDDGRISKGRHDVCRRGEGRLLTSPVARVVPTVGLVHAWIREGMERFSYSENLLWGKGNEMN